VAAFKTSDLTLEGAFKITSNNSLTRTTATLLLVKPFKENLGSLFWVESWPSY
jgi:hypothetical protein